MEINMKEYVFTKEYLQLTKEEYKLAARALGLIVGGFEKGPNADKLLKIFVKLVILGADNT